MIRKSVLLATLIAALLSLVAACGGDDDGNGTASPSGGTETALPNDSSTPVNVPSAEEVQAFFEQAAETLNGGDLAGFIALFSDKGLAEFTGDTVTPTEQLRQESLDRLAGGPTIRVTSVDNIEPFEKNIGVNVNTVQGKALAREYFELLPYQGSYLIDAYERISPQVPAAVRSVTTSATEFKYDFTGADPNGDGNVAFVLNNDGQQPHEIFVLKVAAGPTLDELVDEAVNADPNDLPADIEEIEGSISAGPASTSTLAFAEPLEPGRYALMCFIPDEVDGVAHASKGMSAEFTVE